jgi:hypothetical protein
MSAKINQETEAQTSNRKARVRYPETMDIILCLAFLLLVCTSVSWTIVDIATTKPTKGNTSL